jgi:hypothetical protein
VDLSRPGEQHSFVLKPSNSPLHSTVLNTIRPGSTSSLHNTEVQTTRTSYYSSDKKKANEQKLVSGQELENYVVLVSCRCNHSGRYLWSFIHTCSSYIVKTHICMVLFQHQDYTSSTQLSGSHALHVIFLCQFLCNQELNQ